MTNRRDFLQKLIGISFATTGSQFVNCQRNFPANIALADTIINIFPDLLFELVAPILNGIGQGVGEWFKDAINHLNPYPAQQKEEIINLLRDTLRQYQDNQIQLKLLEIEGNWDLQNWAGILSRQETENLLNKKDSLLILFAPPEMSFDVPTSLRNNLPLEFKSIPDNLKNYYSEFDNKYKVNFYSNYFRNPLGDIHIEQLYNILAPVPTAIFYTEITDYSCRFNVGFWGLKTVKPRIISSLLWNWEKTTIQLMDSGIDEKNALRLVRELMVSSHQLLASYLIDISYLSIDPYYQLKFPQFSKDLTQKFPDHEKYIEPYFLQLKQLQDQELVI